MLAYLWLSPRTAPPSASPTHSLVEKIRTARINKERAEQLVEKKQLTQQVATDKLAGGGRRGGGGRGGGWRAHSTCVCTMHDRQA